MSFFGRKISVVTCFTLLLQNFCFAYIELERHPNWYLLDHATCGVSSSNRIIGGRNASLGQYPWLARIGYSAHNSLPSQANFKCGGSLINPRYVLTAAHCVTELPGTFYVSAIRLGEHNALTPIDCEEFMCATSPQDFRPEKIIVHVHYGHPSYKHDIALIRLDHPAALNPWVQPICLPTTAQLEQNYVGSNAEVAGWGVYDLKYPAGSNSLLYVNLPVVPLTKCSRSFKRYARIGNTQLCVGGIEGEDSCGGDSGGPLMRVDAINGLPRYYQLGIVSFGAKRCGSSTMPAVYTRVSSYMGWILDNIEP